MKTMNYCSPFLFLVLAISLSFSACQKDEANDLAANIIMTSEVTESRTDQAPYYQRPTCLKGQFHYEDGYTDVWINGQWESHGLEDLGASFHVTDANSSIITFRSTQFRLLKQSLIYSADGQCSEKIIGQTYEDEFSTYLRINSQDIFNCIWPQNEEFDFHFKVYGHPL